jgi:hypothetical protein
VKVTHLLTRRVYSATADDSGAWRIAGIPSGQVKVEIAATGFKTTAYRAFEYDAAGGRSLGETKLNVAATSETVEVTAEAPLIETTQSQVTTTFSGGVLNSNGRGFSTDGLRGRSDDKKAERDAKKQLAMQQNQASPNVFNLQKKVSGVLPVQVDVPRAGNSYKFARALVLDEETRLTFNYKTK